MTRAGKIVRNYGMLAVAVLVAGYLLLAGPKYPPVVTAASPDGTWSVSVFASKYADTGFGTCNYEMYANLLDADGRVLGCKLIGIAPDLAAAERDYVVVFENHEAVRIGNKKFTKEDLK